MFPKLNLAEPVLVTGATGFIGSHLVQRLLRDGVVVRAFVLPDEAIPPAWNGRIEVVRGDVTDMASVTAALQPVGTVFHLAAVVGDWGPEALFEAVTVQGTRHVLTAAARAGARVVLTSSIVVYGERLHKQLCAEERPFGRAFGPYSRSKQAQERIGQELMARDGLQLTIVRPANVYGPGGHPWVMEAIEALYKGPTLIDGGRGCAGLVYVDNVVEVLVRAAAIPEAVGRVYNAADDTKVTWRHYFTDLAGISGAPPPHSLPGWLAYPAAGILERVYRWLGRQERPQLTYETLNLITADHHIPSERARLELGYRPLVGYTEGMRRVALALSAGR